MLVARLHTGGWQWCHISCTSLCKEALLAACPVACPSSPPCCASPQFNPGAASSYSLAKQAAPSKRTGYAAAAAGEPTGGPANGAAAAASYRGAAANANANLAAAMGSLGMPGSRPGSAGDAAGGTGSARSSVDGSGMLLPNGSAASGGEGLYGRPTVVLPAAPLGGKPTALESPGFDDFAHMGLISDLLE